MAYGDEELGDLNYPKVSKHLERQIGAFFIAWGLMERELDVSFNVLFRVDPTLSSCITANVGTKAKIDILASAVGGLSLFLGSRLTKSSHAVLERVRALSEKARNTLAHAQMEYLKDTQTQKPGWRLVRNVARKQYSMVTHPTTAEHWRRMTKAVYAAVKAWRAKLNACYRILRVVSEDQLSAKTLMQMKDAEPVFLRRRKNQLPKKSGLQVRQSKQEKRSRIIRT